MTRNGDSVPGPEMCTVHMCDLLLSIDLPHRGPHCIDWRAKWKLRLRESR